MDPVVAVVEASLAALLAPACAACEGLLDHPLDGAICPRCWSSILTDTPPLCERCGAPLPSWRLAGLEAGRCAGCRRGPRRISRLRAIGPYDGALRRIVHALKYGGRSSIARPLGRLMRARGGDILDGATCVVPVPLHPSRRRERGFNQAELLAGALQCPVLRPLVRRRATPPQALLPASRRFGNVRHAFDLRSSVWRLPGGRPDRCLVGQVVVLVDDVVTTGATLEACAGVLLRAGAVEVRALTAARADRPRRSPGDGAGGRSAGADARQRPSDPEVIGAGA